MCCFFFKQKTAYEMRISDWSSDVCSSDLHASMLIVITALIPKRRRKNGMVRMNSVSEICEIDMMIAGYFTAIASWNAGTLAKSCRKVSPYALVSCSAAPQHRDTEDHRHVAVLERSEERRVGKSESER